VSKFFRLPLSFGGGTFCEAKRVGGTIDEFITASRNPTGLEFRLSLTQVPPPLID